MSFAIAPKRVCYFCSEGIGYIDHKDTRLLQKFISRYMKIESRRRTGTCAKHQRYLTTALKRSRHLAMLPFVIQ
ncbi:MAG: 30S ribosomal protein S18 [bacterium]